MITFRLPKFLIAVTLWLIPACVYSSETVTTEDLAVLQSRKLGQNEGHPLKRDLTDATWNRLWERKEKQIFSVLERSALSNSPVVKLELLNSGDYPIIKTLSASSEFDDFYCQQAIWDALPLRDLNSKVHVFDVNSESQGEADYRCTKIFFDLHPHLKDKAVVVHLILPWLGQTSLSPEDIHSISNLRAIPLSALHHGTRLDEFRRDRASYYLKPHYSADKASLLLEADRLDKSFQDLFVK
jgi:hypothetical protein